MSAAPRPMVVTLACVFVGFNAFLLLTYLMEALSNWGTIEMQDALEPSLARLSDSGFDVTMGELLSTLRWAGLVAVLLLVAAMVFAVYAARGDQVSRIGVTVLAVVTGLLITSFGLLGLVQAFFLFFAAMTLWSPDARRWYAARQGTADEGPTAPDAATSVPEQWAAPMQDAQSPSTTTPTIEAPPTPPRTAQHGQAQRPRAVLAAGLVTVIGSSLVGALAGLFLLVYGFAREEYVRLVQDGPFADMYSAGELEAALEAAFWGCLAVLPLCLAGLAAGVLLLARLRLGRVATLTLAWITAAAGAVLFPFGLLGTGAAVTVIVLLHREESRAWTK